MRIGGPPTPAPLPPGAAEGAPRTERFGWRNREKATASSRFERVDDGWRYLDGFLWQPNELVDVELTIEALNEKRPRAL